MHQGVEELSRLLKKAETFYDASERERRRPERLSYVYPARTAADMEKAREVARAVGDAQVTTRRPCMSLHRACVERCPRACLCVCACCCRRVLV